MGVQVKPDTRGTDVARQCPTCEMFHICRQRTANDDWRKLRNRELNHSYPSYTIRVFK